MSTTYLAPSQMQIYEHMARLSGEMAAAAQANDWDELVSLERRVSELRDLLMRQEEVALTLEEQSRKQYLIRQILADDAEVRRHTEPWMEQVRRFLGAGSQQRRVAQAYGVAR